MPAFIYGKDTKFKVYFNNNPWPVNVKNWSIQEVAVESDDPVNGEDRDRSQKITKYYMCKFSCYDDGSSQILSNILANQAAQDANTADLPLAGGMAFYYRDNSRLAFTLKDCTLGPLSITGSGRTTAVMNDISFKAKYLSTVPAV